MKSWYLGHSGFAVEVLDMLLIFDYYKDTPAGGTLAQGVIAPDMLKGKRVTVFSSHGHSDHYNSCVFSWRQYAQDIQYVLSDDIKPPHGQKAQAIAAGQTLTVREDLTVRTLESTDKGVAFVVTTPEGIIYHAGDLNWWHWDEETEHNNNQMGEQYCKQIDLLKGLDIALAFLPADPRQEDKFTLGLDYFMRTVGARRCVPMHLWEKYDICQKLLQTDCTAPYREAIVAYSGRGEQVL